MNRSHYVLTCFSLNLPFLDCDSSIRNTTPISALARRHGGGGRCCRKAAGSSSASAESLHPWRSGLEGGWWVEMWNDWNAPQDALKSAKCEKFHFVQLWWNMNMRWIKIGCKIHTSTPTTKSWSSQIANVLNGDPFWSLHVVTLSRRWRSQTPCCPDVCLVAMWRGISSTDKMTSCMARDIRDIRVLPRGRNTSEMS